MSLPPRSDDFLPVVSTLDWGGRATRAEINLDAIAGNVRALAAHAVGRQLMAVVKADAYGHGAEAVARTALGAGASCLAVYTVEEGITLRTAGIHAPVLVFGPFGSAEAAALLAHGLTATVTSPTALETLAAASRGTRVKVHLKVDTGLTRAGAALNEVDSLADLVGKLPGIEAEGIYTHFACADEPGSTTAAQLAGFRGALQRLQAAGHSFRLIHASNSAGTLWVSDAPCNVVRAGIAMYGYSPNPSRPSPVPLRPALSLLSTVARLTSIAPGTGVGYGHAFRAGRPSRIALVPIGYGDGLHRALGNGVGSVLIRETRAPIVGRISMDQITVDVTDVRGVRAGDDVTIIGRQGAVAQSADDVAAALGTISYEVLTALLRRVPRLYVSGEQILAARTLADLAHEIPDAAGG